MVAHNCACLILVRPAYEVPVPVPEYFIRVPVPVPKYFWKIQYLYLYLYLVNFQVTVLVPRYHFLYLAPTLVKERTYDIAYKACQTTSDLTLYLIACSG